MGSGIAQACAQAGFTVRVRDVDSAAISRGRTLVEKMLAGAIERKKMSPRKRNEVLARISFSTDLAETVREASLVVEAVFEDERVKRTLFAEIAPLVGRDAIVATNTSSLSVTDLSEGFPNPSRFAGLHFFYPAAVNKLVEIDRRGRDRPRGGRGARAICLPCAEDPDRDRRPGRVLREPILRPVPQ